MNIRQAKEYIKNSVRLYLKKDEFGEYRIPVVRQRPLFMLGAPGIGKTAVMEQVAQELNIALVSYSMTHHTRQSALGLPFIQRKEFGGEEYDVSEYTMSEIIASVYETMEESGMKEGILFLDEINCVSETLAPSMLQFLQYKVFGRHSVPEGWVIVTAGNPPEYNRSVREFDVVTMDRLKVLEVEPDYGVWKSYALEKGMHNAVTNYLDLKKEHFYHIETTVRGRSYVTARGWEDLSEMLQLYEEEGLPVDETLVGQYLRSERIVKEFTAYYDLYQKYRKDYRIGEILKGKGSEDALRRAGAASFDERLSLIGMLLDQVQSEIRSCVDKSAYLAELTAPLKGIRAAISKQEGADSDSVIRMLETQEQTREKWIESRKKASALSDGEKQKQKRVLRFLESARRELYLEEKKDGEGAFALLKAKFDGEVAALKAETARTQKALHEMFVFTERAFSEENGAAAGNEMLILVTELTVNEYSAKFISMFGSEDYQKHNRELMLTERQNELQQEIAALAL